MTKKILKMKKYLETNFIILIETRRVWRYQKGNLKPYIEEEQTTQWPKGQTTIYKTYT